MANPASSREAIARKEIGVTTVSTAMARLLLAAFLLLIFCVPLYQLILDKGLQVKLTVSADSGATSLQQTLAQRIDGANTGLLQAMDEFERGLEENSFLRGWCLPPLQYVFSRYLGQGNEKVVIGMENTLFYAPDVDYLVGPPFLDGDQLALRRNSNKQWEAPVQSDPVAAIVDFHRQLQERNIRLLVLVVPVKPSVEPGKLSRREVPAPLANRSWDHFQQGLAKAGVQLLDIRESLVGYVRKHGSGYLATDTHWLPETMGLAAEQLAGEIRRLDPGLSPSVNLQQQEKTIVGEGDIGRMLVLPDGVRISKDQQVQIRQVVNEQQEFWQPDKEAEILLLGDSFTNIYGVDGLAWGRGAGFAEQLSYRLQVPVDLLAKNDNGAFVTRQMLAAELARGRDRLAGKKIVIWEFAERELAFGDWKLIPMKLGEPGESAFLTVAGGEEKTVSGVVAAISRSPVPGSVPYRDNIITMQLIDLSDGSGPLADDQALVYGWGMRNNQLTALAGIRPGDTVRMKLVAWDDVEPEYGSYRRSPLDDDMMELELPNWGELLPE